MGHDTMGKIGPSFSPHSIPHQIPAKALSSTRSSSSLPHLLAHGNSFSSAWKIFFFFFSPPKHYTFTTVFTSRSSSSWFSCRKRETAKYPIKESSLHYYFQAISYFMSETLRLSVTQEELIQTVTKTQQKNPVW